MIEKTLKKDNTIYYIYKDAGVFALTTKQNFDAYIMDAHKITKFDGFTNAKQVVDYLQKYCGSFEVL